MKFTLLPLAAAVLTASLMPLAAQAVEVPIRADAHYSLETGEAGINYGTGANMVANSSSRKALIKFKALSQFLPSSATSSAKIDKAILHVYVTKVTDITAKFVISRLDQDWLESSVTGNTPPLVAASPAPYTEPVTITAPGLWYNLDVTNIAKYWLDHPSEPRGIMLQTTVGEVEIDSKENTATSHVAHLDISLTGGSGTVTSVSGTGPLSVADGTTTPAISIAQASNATDGYLSANDWNVFNNKGTVTNVTGSAPISVATGTTAPSISINQASSNMDGYLSAADWVLFNAKLSANGDGSSLTGITGSQISGNIAGNAGTATNLAANGSDCAAGNYPLGVDAAGNAESCTPAATGTITGVTAGTGLTGGGSSGNVTLSIDSVPGSSVIGNISGNAATATTSTMASALTANGANCSAGQFPLGVDAQGNAESCTTAGTITGITAGTGLAGGGASGSVALNLSNTGVTSGSYTNANITVDAQGRVTAAANGSGGGSNATSIQGVNVANTAPTNGQVLTYNGSNWTPSTTGAGNVVKDANGNVLGTILGFTGGRTPVVVIQRNGYLLTLSPISGKFNVTQTYWTGTTCGNGSPYVNAGGLPSSPPQQYYTKSVVYLASSNQLYVPVGTPGTFADAVSFNAAFIENAGSTTGSFTCTASAQTTGGWQMTAINPATVLGWTVSGNPLAVAAPLILP